MPPVDNSYMSGRPTRQQQSYGAIISIAIIVLIVVVGAFYTWGKRLADNSTETTNVIQQPGADGLEN